MDRIEVDRSVFEDDSELDHEADIRQEVQDIRSELQMHYRDLLDKESPLAPVLKQWLRAARDVSATAPGEQVIDRLNDVSEDNAMYRTEGVRDPTEEFPKDCKDCPHYGVHCPVIADHDGQQTLQRIIDGTDDPKQLRRSLRQYAIRKDCLVIKQELDNIEKELEPLLNLGQELKIAIEEIMTRARDKETVHKEFVKQARKSSLPNGIDPQTVKAAAGGSPRSESSPREDATDVIEQTLEGDD